LRLPVKNGGLNFSLLFLFFSLYVLYACSCTMPQVQGDFYRALALKDASDDVNDSVKHFEKALLSQNDYVRQAAAEEIASLEVEGAEVSSVTAEWVRLAVTGYWARAFAAVEPAPDKDKALEVLLSFEQGEAFPDAARVYVLRECEKQKDFFTEAEAAAIQGHYLITRQHYGEALESFRVFRAGNGWPARIPELFLKYPVLINDLGRAFQFTNSSGTEGLTLFLQWEEDLEESEPDEVRYRLLFYAARVARRAGQAAKAVSIFERAFPFAPDDEQMEACIWYILDTTLRESVTAKPELNNFIEQLEKYAPLWKNGRYFDDIMERYLQVLNSGKEWGKLTRAYEAVKKNGGPFARSAYPWVISRLITEGLLSADELQLAAKAANATSADPRAYIWFAYNGADRHILSALYYRHLGAEALEMPFLELHAPSAVHENPTPVMQFLLGFFSHHAAEYSLPYIRRFENDLSANELRALADALHRAGLYAPSIRLVSLYINNDGYAHNRHDLELLFPRPHRELVEKYAKEFHMEPSLLFALIRTESAFQSSVVSRAGAVGLTQLMPATAREMAQRIRRSGGPDYAAGGLNLIDPSLNIHMGAYYYNYLFQRFNNTLSALFAYNGGMSRVTQWRRASSLPDDLFLETVTLPETRDYGRKVLAAQAAYEDLYYRRGH
jgi:soluble lytic murein transglycosylase